MEQKKDHIGGKVLAVALAACMLVGYTSVGLETYFSTNTVVEAATETSASDFTYTITSSNEISIKKYIGSAENVVIPSEIEGYPVTKISACAFYNCQTIKNVVVPDTVTAIERQAFMDCRALESVTLSKNITQIKDTLFSCCLSLKEITIPDGVTIIEEHAFYSCESLQKVTMSNSVQTIGEYAFAHCYALKEIPNITGVTSMGESVFSHCTSLTEVTIPGGCSVIPEYAFIGCTNLSKVTLEEGITDISSYAFKNTALKSVTIPSTVTYLGRNIFEECGQLETCIYSEGITKIEGIIFGEGTSVKYLVFPSSLNYIAVWVDKSDFPEATIYGVKGSYAESYAAENDIPFMEYKSLKNTSVLDTDILTIGEGMTLKATAENGLGTYEYSMLVKNSSDSDYTVLKDFDEVSTVYWEPSKYGTYDVVIQVKDKSDNIVSKNFTVTVKTVALKNTSSVTATTVTLGSGITLKGSAEGGTGEYQYAIAARHSTASSYTVLKNYDSTATKYWKPAKTGKYYVVIKVKDTEGTVVSKNFTITVYEPMVNTSFISAETVTIGSGITLTGSATGGSGKYQYAITAKHSTASNYTVLKNYSTTASKYWKPSKTGTYTVQIKVKDTTTGKIDIKTFTVTVKEAELKNNSVISATTINKGESVILTGQATGGTAPYQYAMVVRHSTDSSWTTIKAYNTTATKTWTPAKSGVYTVQIKVKDSTNKVITKTFTLTVK